MLNKDNKSLSVVKGCVHVQHQHTSSNIDFVHLYLI